MEFNISITIDEKAKHKSHLIIDLSESLKSYFQDKNYGEDNIYWRRAYYE